MGRGVCTVARDPMIWCRPKRTLLDCLPDVQKRKTVTRQIQFVRRTLGTYTPLLGQKADYTRVRLFVFPRRLNPKTC